MKIGQLVPNLVLISNLSCIATKNPAFAGFFVAISINFPFIPRIFLDFFLYSGYSVLAFRVNKESEKHRNPGTVTDL